MSHTKGPWIHGSEMEKNGFCKSEHYLVGPGILCEQEGTDEPVYGGRFVAAVVASEPEGEANARLIASAPEMLEALEMVLSDSEEKSQGGVGRPAHEIRMDLRKAIAKAKGETE